MMYSDLQWPLKISCLMTCVRNSDKICKVTDYHGVHSKE
jgi:hypothetical protein